MNHVSVVGAGLTGCLAAARLADRGADVALYDRRPDPRTGEGTEGRSINLALSTRGLDALERIDLASLVADASIPMHGRMMHDRTGALTFQPYAATGDHLLSVNRDDLNHALLDAADARPSIATHFSTHIDDIDPDAPAIVLADGTHEPTDLIVGADGAYSAVRSKLQRSGRFNYEQDYLEHGYKELTIPAAAGGGYRIDPNALHIWPRGTHMMIALANPGGSFTCTLFWPFSGVLGFETIDTEDEVIAAFEHHFPDAIDLMPTLATEYLANPTGSLVTVRCWPWYRDDRVVLLGDAAHAVVPFYGQGANAALEDVTLLIDALDDHSSASEAIESFAVARKVDADALADLAIDNFVEMRDRVSSRWFLAKKAAKARLNVWLPGRFVPLYNMVTFSRIGYAEARDRAARQDRRLRLAILLAILLLVLVVVTVSAAII